jgi:hypothetical protein
VIFLEVLKVVGSIIGAAAVGVVWVLLFVTWLGWMNRDTDTEDDRRSKAEYHNNMYEGCRTLVPEPVGRLVDLGEKDTRHKALER